MTEPPVRPGPAADEETMVAGGLVIFANLLRAAGVEVGTGAVQTAAGALSCVVAADRGEAYWALRCSLLSRRQDLPAFDAVFSAFWGEEPLPMGLPSKPSPGGTATAPEAPTATRTEISVADPGDERDASSAGASWSPLERLREMDFSDYGPGELATARRLIGRIARSLPVRRSRRTRPSHGRGRIDPRQTLRQALRTGGHPLELRRRRRKLVPRKLVFVVDVSGSMEPYARPVVMFLHAARRSSRKVEAFAFGTRVTRLTGALDHGDPEASLERVAEAVPDWAGGTRIGASLKALRGSFQGGSLASGAVVVIVSDGWERGNLPLLGAEMARLQRTAYAVVWVNPLAGDPEYEPLAAGMATARPFVDVFLSGHNLRALEALAESLERLAVEEKPSLARAEPASPWTSSQAPKEKYDVGPSAAGAGRRHPRPPGG